MKKALPLLLLIVVGLVIGLNLGKDSTKPVVGTRQPSFIFVTIDTLRDDHVGAYGYPRDVTPFFDRLAKEGVVFQNVFSASSASIHSVITFCAIMKNSLLRPSICINSLRGWDTT